MTGRCFARARDDCFARGSAPVPGRVASRIFLELFTTRWARGSGGAAVHEAWRGVAAWNLLEHDYYYARRDRDPSDTPTNSSGRRIGPPCPSRLFFCRARGARRKGRDRRGKGRGAMTEIAGVVRPLPGSRAGRRGKRREGGGTACFASRSGGSVEPAAEVHGRAARGAAGRGRGPRGGGEGGRNEFLRRSAPPSLPSSRHAASAKACSCCAPDGNFGPFRS